MKILKAIITIFTVLLIASGCAPSQDAATDNKPIIYTSIYPIQYAVERIADDFVTAKTVYPPGVDAHTYEPTSKEMTNIAKGDAFFFLGAGMESFAESAADALATQDTKLVALGENESLFHTETDHIEADHEDDGHQHGDHDPHIWLDPIRMIDMAEMIKDDLVELYPEQKEDFNQNFEALKADLIDLNTQYETVLQNKKDKEILVSHAAFGYWEERYGVTQIAINGLSSSSEPSQKELTKIVDQAKEHKLKYIIFEQNVSNHVSEIIQDHIGAKPLTIHNLSVLTEEDIENDADYISLMHYNLDILDKATN